MRLARFMEEVNSMSVSNNPIAPVALDDVCFVARRILAMIKDPRTNADRLGRVIDSMETLASMVIDAANDLFGDRGRIHTSSQAITVIGFNRLETLTRRFLYTEFARLSAGEEPVVERMQVALSAPVAREVPEFIQVQEVRASIRYAAIA